MQEWFQPEGDILNAPPLDTIQRFLDQFAHPVIVKEVGQGMGPESLRELLQLPLQAIEFAAFGGTNFAKVELLRDRKQAGQAFFEPLSMIGEDVYSMLDYVNDIVAKEASGLQRVDHLRGSGKFPGRILPYTKIYSACSVWHGIHFS